MICSHGIDPDEEFCTACPFEESRALYEETLGFVASVNARIRETDDYRAAQAQRARDLAIRQASLDEVGDLRAQEAGFGSPLPSEWIKQRRGT